MRSRQQLQAIINDMALLEAACESVGSLHIDPVRNQTLEVQDIEIEDYTHNVRFKIIQSWQGDAQVHHFSFPSFTIAKAMEPKEKTDG